MVEVRKAHPEIPYFRLHNFRGTAMSRAMEAGANYNDASITFGCHPETIRKNDSKFDEPRVSDSVMDRIREESYNRKRLPKDSRDKSVEEGWKSQTGRSKKSPQVIFVLQFARVVERQTRRI